MKKVIFSVLVIIVVILCSFAVLCFQSPKTLPDGTIEIDFMKDRPNWLASRILYNYVLKEVKMSPKEAKDANIVPSAVKAYFVDLNDDGKKEIIGYVGSGLYLSSEGFDVFILQRSGKYYSNLSGVKFLPNKTLFVLSSKVNDFREIEASVYSNEYRLKGKFYILNVRIFYDNSNYAYDYSVMNNLK